MKRKFLMFFSGTILSTLGIVNLTNAQTKVFVPAGTAGIVNNTNATTNPNNFVGIGAASFSPTQMLHINGGNLQINNATNTGSSTIHSNITFKENINAEFVDERADITHTLNYDYGVLTLSDKYTSRNYSLGGIQIGSTDVGNRVCYGFTTDIKDMVLQASGATKILAITNSKERLRIDAAGNVGIGTNAPGYLLDVNGTARFNGSAIIGNTAAGTNVTLSGYVTVQGNDLAFGKNDGRPQGANLGQRALVHFDYTGANTKDHLILNYSNDFDNGVVVDGIGLGIGIAPTSYKLDVNGNSYFRGNTTLTGVVNIGGKTPAAYTNNESVKLYIGGYAIAQKFVCTSLNWADYVFDKNYQLTPLSDVEAFIKTNKHLPSIPSATEIEKNGVDTGEMLRLQMMKIEELTLHLIAQQKQLQAQKAEIDALKLLK